MVVPAQCKSDPATDLPAPGLSLVPGLASLAGPERQCFAGRPVSAAAARARVQSLDYLIVGAEHAAP